MRRTSALIPLAFVALGVLVCSSLASVGGNTVILDGDGLAITSPKAQVEAQIAAQQAADLAAAAAIDRQAQAGILPSKVLGWSVFYVGFGTAGAVLMVLCAFALGARLNLAARTIRPGKDGQLPVIVSSGPGWTAYHDPARGLGPGALYRQPTAFDALVGAVGLLTGKRQPQTDLAAEYPATGSEQAMLQVASQAQAVGLMAAATRNPGKTSEQAARVAQGVAAGALPGGGGMGARMPSVKLVTEPAQLEQVLELYEGGHHA